MGLFNSASAFSSPRYDTPLQEILCQNPRALAYHGKLMPPPSPRLQVILGIAKIRYSGANLFITSSQPPVQTRATHDSQTTLHRSVLPLPGTHLASSIKHGHCHCYAVTASDKSQHALAKSRQTSQHLCLDTLHPMFASSKYSNKLALIPSAGYLHRGINPTLPPSPDRTLTDAIPRSSGFGCRVP